MQQKIELVKSDKSNFIEISKAKKYLRINHEYDDELISEMLETAYVAAENYIGVKLKKAIWKLTIYGGLPDKIRLVHAPINRVESFKICKNNNEELYITNDHYLLDNNATHIYMRRSYIIKKAEISYSVGFEVQGLPMPIRQGILEHLAKLYDLRGSDQELPLAAKSLYQAYKKVRM